MQNRKLDVEAQQHNVYMKGLHRSVPGSFCCCISCGWWLFYFFPKTYNE